MKRLDDWAGAVFFLLYLCVVFFFPWSPEGGWSLRIAESLSSGYGLNQFGATVSEWPYLSGFLKVGILAMFGEMVKTRRRTGSWRTPRILPKFIVWGGYGMLFTMVFALFRNGVAANQAGGLWPSFGDGAWAFLLTAFSVSVWLNLIFCYPMMLGHEYLNACIAAGGPVGGEAFFRTLDPHVWGSYLPKTILFFWIPAHTITFCLPPAFQILMSALLSLALGFILTIRPRKRRAEEARA